MVKILLREMYHNKKIVLFYLTACIVVTAFFTPIFGNWNDVYAMQETLTEGETVDALLDTFTGKSITQLAGSYSQIVGISAEPFTALLLIGVIENLNHLLGSPLSIASTPAGNPIVLLIVFIFFAAGKIMRSNEATQVFGMVTLGELEKYLGFAFILILGVLNVAGISTAAASGVVNAASTVSADVAASGNWLMQSVSVVTSIVVGLLSMVVFYIVKTAFWGIEVIQISVSFIPGSAFVFELLKSILVVFLVTVNVLFPKIGAALNIIVFIVCCILFKVCYAAMQYFRKIYFKPTIKMIKGYNPYKEICDRKIPKKLVRYFYPNGEEANFELAIPVYALKKVEELPVIKRYESWWFVRKDGENLFCKTKLFSKKITVLPLTNRADMPFYIHKGLRFFEVFDLMPYNENQTKRTFRKKRRHMSYAFSKEYWHRFEDILSITQLTDYAIIKAEEKQTRKQLKEEKKLKKQEERIQKKLEKGLE